MVSKNAQPVLIGDGPLKKHGRSFYWASLFLPAHVRAHAVALYAFCRWLDDAVDEAASAEDAQARLEELEMMERAKMATKKQRGSSPTPSAAPGGAAKAKAGPGRPLSAATKAKRAEKLPEVGRGTESWRADGRGSSGGCIGTAFRVVLT